MWKTYQFADRTIGKKHSLKIIALSVKILIGMYNDVLKKRPVIRIFYATETGTAKYFAEKFLKLFEKVFNASIFDMTR